MDKRFYEEYKASRKLGQRPEEAIWWARLMRDCGYDPFQD